MKMRKKKKVVLCLIWQLLQRVLSKILQEVLYLIGFLHMLQGWIQELRKGGAHFCSRKNRCGKVYYSALLGVSGGMPPPEKL